MKKYLVMAALLLAALGMVRPALADDWTASKLRGLVFVNDLAGDNKWVPLARGEVIADTRYVRTMTSGHLELTRGTETIELDPNTQLRILDRNGQHFTTVMQDYGQVTIAADVENVKHFAIETPYLVAVVKGTQFTVTSDDHGSIVKVKRGLVGVTDKLSHKRVDVPAGQQLSDSSAGQMLIAGKASGAQLPGEDATDATGLVPGTVGEVGDVVGGFAGLPPGLVGNTHEAATSIVHDTVGTVAGVVHGVGSLLHL